MNLIEVLADTYRAADALAEMLGCLVVHVSDQETLEEEALDHARDAILAWRVSSEDVKWLLARAEE